MMEEQGAGAGRPSRGGLKSQGSSMAGRMKMLQAKRAAVLGADESSKGHTSSHHVSAAEGGSASSRSGGAGEGAREGAGGAGEAASSGGGGGLKGEGRGLRAKMDAVARKRASLQQNTSGSTTGSSVEVSKDGGMAGRALDSNEAVGVRAKSVQKDKGVPSGEKGTSGLLEHMRGVVNSTSSPVPAPKRRERSKPSGRKRTSAGSGDDRDANVMRSILSEVDASPTPFCTAQQYLAHLNGMVETMQLVRAHW